MFSLQELVFSDIILLVSLSIFFIGFFSLISYRKNLILVLFSLEIILLGINLSFLSSSLFINDIEGYLFTMFILVVAGSEISIGLALIILFYRVKSVIYTDVINFLKS